MGEAHLVTMLRPKKAPEDVVAVVKQQYSSKGDEITFEDIQYIGEFSLQQTLKGEALLDSAEPNNFTEALLVFKHASESLLEVTEIRKHPKEQQLRDTLEPLLLRAQLGEANTLLSLQRWEDTVELTDAILGNTMPRPAATSLVQGFPLSSMARCIKAVAFAAAGQKELAAAEVRSLLALPHILPAEKKQIQLLLDYIECSAEIQPESVSKATLFHNSLMRFLSQCKTAASESNTDESHATHERLQEEVAELEEALRVAFVALGQEDQLQTLLQAIKATPTAYTNDKRPVVRQLAAAVHQVSGEASAPEVAAKPRAAVSSSNSEGLDGWLAEQDLEQYRDVLKQLGVDQVSDLKWLQESDLDGFTIPPLHKKQIVDMMKE